MHRAQGSAAVTSADSQTALQTSRSHPYVSQVEGLSGKEVRVYAKDGLAEPIVEGTDLLVSVGRTPNTKGIGLEHVGVELDDRGYIKVNDRLETTASNVWAMGDCAGSPQFTHVAYHDFASCVTT
jgi:pyruvate/2-oxoglutarate dehydrogenase complex dihydrolipoamide dehydrogenase (E3) component